MGDREERTISSAFGSMPYLLGQLLEWPTQLYPDRAAIDGEFGQLSFEELKERISARKIELADLGAVRGGRWGLAYSTGLDFLTDLLALWQLECIASPLRTAWKAERLEELVVQAQLDGVLGSQTIPARLTPRTRDRSERRIGGATDLDVAMVLWTSGSTGDPRGVALQHHAVIANIVGNVNSLGIRDDDRTLVVLPLSHAYSLIGQCLCHLAVGGTLVFPKLPLVPTSLCRTLEDQRISTLALAPPLLKFMVAGLQRTHLTCPNLRLITVGAAQARAEDLEAVRDLLPNAKIALTYGLTEAGPRISTRFLGDGPVDPACVGMTLPNVAVTEAEGVLQVHSRSQMAGYLDSLDSRGEGLATGDLGSIESGAVTLTGRVGRSINRGGVMVSPERIECVLGRHERVIECRVVSTPHPLYGEVPAALVRGNSVTADELMRWCAAHLSPEELPASITLCDSLEPVAKEVDLAEGILEEQH